MESISESPALHEDSLNLVLDFLDFRFKLIDSLVYVLVRFFQICEEMNLHLLRCRRVVVICLDELHLGRESSKLLLDSTVPVFLHFVDLLAFDDSLLKFVNLGLLSLN